MEIERKKLLRLKIQNKYPNAILSPFSYKEFEKINSTSGISTLEISENDLSNFNELNTTYINLIKQKEKFIKDNGITHFFENNLKLGIVKEIHRYPLNDYLEVITDSELVKKALPKNFLIPHIFDKFILNIDIENKRIDVINSFDILDGIFVALSISSSLKYTTLFTNAVLFPINKIALSVFILLISSIDKTGFCT